MEEVLSTSVVKPAHIHTYKRVKHPTRRDLWMCLDPHCNLRVNQIFMLGKAALCPYCQEEFLITSRKLNKQSLLHCDKCKRGGRGAAKPKELVPTLDDITKKLGELL